MKNLLLTTLFIAILTASNAQELYIKPLFSFSSGLLPTTYSTASDATTITIDTSITEYTYEQSNISLGAGKRFGLAFEYQPNNKLAYGFSASWFKSNDHEIISSSKMEYDPYVIYNLQIIQTDIFRKKSLDLNLYTHIYLSEGSTAFYLNTGLLFSISNLGLHREVFIRNNMPGYYPTEKYEYEYKITPSLHYGVSSSAGVELWHDKFVSAFIEANAIFMNITPKTRTCTSKTWNDEDQTASMTISERDGEYVESYSDTDNASDNEPTKILSYKKSCSSIGIVCGFRINL
ncbi:MAG: hypothetical protein JXR53_01805 [Bacteroidales bacterium]|nr:hypothetical protein [Bacteroidales bacterium]